jgi:hypothetical protein
VLIGMGCVRQGVATHADIAARDRMTLSSQ